MSELLIPNSQQPLHPGKILQVELLAPLQIVPTALARDLQVPEQQVNEIVSGQQNINADMALRLAQYFGIPPEFWLKLQLAYDLYHARQQVQPDTIAPAANTEAIAVWLRSLRKKLVRQYLPSAS